MFDNKFPSARILLAIIALLLACPGGVASADHEPSPAITVVVDGSWGAGEADLLRAWTAHEGPILKTLNEVYGPPAAPIKVTVTKSDRGLYDRGRKMFQLASAIRFHLVHELTHVLRDSANLVLNNRVWEEGSAVAATNEVMRLLTRQGIVDPMEYDSSQGQDKAQFYENWNLQALGAPNTVYHSQDDYNPGTRIRYQMAGFAFGKVLLENPQFFRGFNSLLFSRAKADIDRSQLIALAAEAQQAVEGVPTALWLENQSVFDVPAAGCRLLLEVQLFAIHFLCTQDGKEVPQVGMEVGLTVFGHDGRVVRSGTGATDEFGRWGLWIPPNLPPERLRIEATANSLEGPLTSTNWRRSGPEEGIFGVVVNANCGSVSFRSPVDAFEPLTVPVVNGSFAAPSLVSHRGQIAVAFTGPSGRVFGKTITKDASPYSMVIPGPDTLQYCPPPAKPRLKRVSPTRVSAKASQVLRSRFRVKAIKADGSPAAGVKVSCSAKRGRVWFQRSRFKSQKATVISSKKGIATCPRMWTTPIIGQHSIRVSAGDYGSTAFDVVVRRRR